MLLTICWSIFCSITVFMAIPHVKQFCFFFVFFQWTSIVPIWDKHFDRTKSIMCCGKMDFTRNCTGFARLLRSLILKLVHAVTRYTEGSTVWDLFGKFKGWRQKSRGVQSALQMNLLVSASRWDFVQSNFTALGTWKRIHSHCRTSVTSDDSFSGPFSIPSAALSLCGL